MSQQSLYGHGPVAVSSSPFFRLSHHTITNKDPDHVVS